MAYFRQNNPNPDDIYPIEEEEEEYNDGFDELTDEEIPEITEDERKERRMSHIRMAIGAGNLFGIIAGTVLILILLGLIFSIIHFVMNDMARNFSLFQTNF